MSFPSYLTLYKHSYQKLCIFIFVITIVYMVRQFQAPKLYIINDVALGMRSGGTRTSVDVFKNKHLKFMGPCFLIYFYRTPN